MKKHKKNSWTRITNQIPLKPLFLGVTVTLFLLTFFTHIHTSLCANSISCISDLTGSYNHDTQKGEFGGRQISVLPYAPDRTNNPVLGTISGANKRIEIDLTNQHLYAFEDNTVVYSFPVSTGKWGRTPTGDFTIWIKLSYTRMKGGSKLLGTYYDLPNVPSTMYFYNAQIPKSKGYGIHGAYWHNNFGHPMSHGCINLSVPDAKILYDWATPISTAHTTLTTTDNPGTAIKIYGNTPTN